MRTTVHERLSIIQSCTWTLKLLVEALVHYGDTLEGAQPPRLTFRNAVGIHRAIRIIYRLASEQVSKLEAMK